MSFRRFLPRLGRRWSLLLLLASAAATVAALVQAHQTLRSQNKLMETVRKEYGEFAAWSYEQHLQQALLEAAKEPLQAVNHGEQLHTSPRIPHASEIAHFMPWDQECLCHRPRLGPSPSVTFGFELGSDTIGIGINWHRPARDGWLGDEPNIAAPPRPLPSAASFGTRYRWINDTLTALVRSGFKPRAGYAWVVSQPHGEESRYVAYTMMATSWGDTLLYGMQYDSTAFAGILQHVFDQKDLLPAAFSRHGPNRDIITVQVADGEGRPMFRSQPNVRWALDTWHKLDQQAGAVQVRAQIRQPATEKLIIGGAPNSRMPFLYVLLALAAALSLVSLAQIARESDLARSRESFVSSISHELRTPVAQIRLYLETLRLGRAEDPVTREWSLANIDRETQRLSNLVDNVLRFSRSKTDIVAAPPERVDVAHEIEALVEEFRPLAASRKVNLALETHAPDTYAWISRDALRHILLNLFDNAVKYGPAGQTIRVSVDAPGERARIAVSDEGPGIPQAERASIWEAFTRGNGKATKAVGGSGIGLTIVRDLVSANGGTIRVDDAPGGGAAFVVELPMHRPASV